MTTRSSPAVDIYDPSGQPFLHLVVQTPQHEELSISDTAIDTDGTVAVSGAYQDSKGFAAAVFLFDRNGKQRRSIDTGRYVPTHLCFAPDHTVWALGWQRSSARDGYEDHDYFLFHKYAPDGTELGAYVRRSLFATPGLGPGSGQAGSWTMRAAKDRIGAFLFPGKVSNDPVWIELDLNGNLLGQWHTGSLKNAGQAFTASGRLFRTTLLPTGERSFKVLLDEFVRATSTWQTLETATNDAPNYYGWLLGADGDDLVFNKEAGLRIFWVTPPR